MKNSFICLLVIIMLISSAAVSFAASDYNVEIDKTVYIPGTHMTIQISAPSDDWFTVEILKGNTTLMSLPAAGADVILEVLIPTEWKNGSYVLRAGRGASIDSVTFEINSNIADARYTLEIDKTAVMVGDTLILSGTSSIANLIVQYYITASSGGFIPQTGDVAIVNNRFECFVPIDSAYAVGTYSVKVGSNDVFSNKCDFSVTSVPKVASISASPRSSEVSPGTKITLATSTPNAAIYYTLNGTTPTSSSTLYTSSGVTINSTATLKAVAMRSGYANSDILTQTYTVGGGGDIGGGGGGGLGGGEIADVTLTFNTNGGSVIAGIAKAAGTVIDLTAYKPIREGYDFAGWYGDRALTKAVTSVTLEVNTTVYAKWTAKEELAGGQLFTDVRDSDWFSEAVKYVSEKGLMKGTGDTTFGPYRTTTRGMIVTILHRLEGEPAAGANGFSDVAAGKYYAGAAAWAAEGKIVSGYGDGGFGPEDPITREQLAVILMNYAKLKGYDVTARVDLTKFEDSVAVSDWAKEAMSWANAKGLIQGSNNNLMPSGKAERCQVAAILQRFIENIAK